MRIKLTSEEALVLLWLSIVIALILSGCTTVKTIITTTQLHVVTKVDTVAKKDVRISIQPIAPPTTSMGNGLKPGDTIKVLTNIIRKY